MSGSSTPVEVFYSYAHKDESFCTELENHLSLLRRQGVITAWHDRHILPGADWAQAIDEHLEGASIIPLLISADFLSSDYSYGVEMTRALECHQAHEARVIPILQRPVDWHGAPFAHLQALPTDAKAITTWRNRDTAFADVVAGIRRAAEASPDGCYTAVFRRHSSEGRGAWTAAQPNADRKSKSPRSWYIYANNPLRERVTHELVAQLRGYLKEWLPDYMIPGAFVLLEALPLTPNGKLNRQGLPAPIVIPEMGEDFVAPRTEIEEALAEIWASVLGLERIGVYNNFFESGGDSIRSILIIAKARQAGLRLTPQQMFQHQTIAELASVAQLAPVLPEVHEPETATAAEQFLLAKLDQQELDRLIGVNQQVEDIYPLSPLQEHMLVRYLADPEPGLYSMQRIILMQGKLDISAFERAWQQVVARHPLMRTSFVWEGLTEPLQVVHKETTLSLEQQDWRGLSPAEQEEQLEHYLQTVRARGLELTKSTVLRLLVAQVGENSYQFALSNRYISTDGWSFMLLINEAFIFYNAFSQDKELQLERGRPYQDYIAWLQRQDIASAEIFWRQGLKGFTAATPLVDRARENVHRQEKDSGFARQSFFLATSTTKELQVLARQHHLTPNTILQGVWALLLSHYSGEEEVTFGVSVSGRPADLAGVESIVGVLMNTLPARVHVSPEDSLLPWLKKLQDRQVELQQYEYTPLRKIYEWSAVPRDRLLFESYLVFQNFEGLAATLERPFPCQTNIVFFSPGCPRSSLRSRNTHSE